MNYIITEQYANGEEKPIAELDELDDVHLFLSKKMSNDEIQHKALIYRLYNDAVLVKKFNQESISVAHAQYEESDSAFINLKPFAFKVMIQTANTLEKRGIAHFNDRKDAILFIAEKCQADQTVMDNDLFYLFKERLLIQTLNKIMVIHQRLEEDLSKSNPSGATFHPTPTPMRPTPQGGPSDCWIEHDDGESDKK